MKKRKNNTFVEKGRELIGSLLFPKRCPVCEEILEPEQVEKGIHSACEKKLVPVGSHYCMHCGRPLGRRDEVQEALFQEISQSREYCQECIKLYTSLQTAHKDYATQINFHSHIISGCALYLYQGAIKNTMYRFKYSNKRDYAQFFVQEAVTVCSSWLQKNQIDVIVPVPMYEKKKKLRGYNQAEVFAEALSKRTGIPVDKELIKRIKDTTPQKELNDIERKNNLKNAFQKRKSIVQYMHVLVVDDIYTTGATVEAVAKEIKNTGVCQVYTLCICIGRDV